MGSQSVRKNPKSVLFGAIMFHLLLLRSRVAVSHCTDVCVCVCVYTCDMFVCAGAATVMYDNRQLTGQPTLGLEWHNSSGPHAALNSEYATTSSPATPAPHQEYAKLQHAGSEKMAPTAAQHTVEQPHHSTDSSVYSAPPIQTRSVRSGDTTAVKSPSEYNFAMPKPSDYDASLAGSADEYAIPPELGDLEHNYTTLEKQQTAGTSRSCELYEVVDAQTTNGDAAAIPGLTVVGPSAAVVERTAMKGRSVLNIYSSTAPIRTGHGAILPWLHSSTTDRAVAEKLLQSAAAAASPGSLVYLVRGRVPHHSRAPGLSCYALSFMVNGKIKHTTLDVGGDEDGRANGRRVAGLGTTLAEMVPTLVAQYCQVHKATRSEPVLSPDTDAVV